MIQGGTRIIRTAIDGRPRAKHSNSRSNQIYDYSLSAWTEHGEKERERERAMLELPKRLLSKNVVGIFYYRVIIMISRLRITTMGHAVVVRKMIRNYFSTLQVVITTNRRDHRRRLQCNRRQRLNSRPSEIYRFLVTR